MYLPSTLVGRDPQGWTGPLRDWLHGQAGGVRGLL